MMANALSLSEAEKTWGERLSGGAFASNIKTGTNEVIFLAETISVAMRVLVTMSVLVHGAMLRSTGTDAERCALSPTKV
jgi:hypothetical protein